MPEHRADQAGDPAAQAGGPEWEVPWPADGAGGSSWSPERAQLAMAFAAAVRKTGSLMHLMSQAAADRIGINPTDLNCLNILSFSGQLTAGELAGFVHRERDSSDRRRVVIHLNTERALSTVAPVFGPMMGAWQRMAGQYS